MRQYIFPLDIVQTDWAFSAIRSKLDYAEVLLNAVKAMLTPLPPADHLVASTLVLQIAKMSRLFFVKPQKIYSVNFPFITAEHAEGHLTFSSHAHPSIDQRATSIAIGLLMEMRRQRSGVLDFAANVDEASQADPHAWDLLLEILTIEDGYVRYDDDLERADGDRHPRHHLDVFYSNQITFKLGLFNTSSQDELVDVLNILTDCHYISRRR